MAPMFEREQESCCECHSKMEILLRDAVKLGQLPPDTDTALVMQILHSFMVGVMHEWLLDPGAYDLGRHAEAFVDTMLTGSARCAAAQARGGWSPQWPPVRAVAPGAVKMPPEPR